MRKSASEMSKITTFALVIIEAYTVEHELFC